MGSRISATFISHESGRHSRNFCRSTIDLNVDRHLVPYSPNAPLTGGPRFSEFAGTKSIVAASPSWQRRSPIQPKEENQPQGPTILGISPVLTCRRTGGQRFSEFPRTVRPATVHDLTANQGGPGSA